MSQENLSQCIEKIESFDKVLQDFSARLMRTGATLYPLDMLAIGVINRSMSLLYGFTTLIQHDNYIAASHLVRPHLDNYLRFYAAWLVTSPHEYATKIMEGIQVNKLKDKDGEFMHDNYLAKRASEHHSWMHNVYKVSSGFIHLSKKHVFTSTKVLNEAKRKVEFRISKTDKYVPEESKIEAAACMIEITSCIIQLLEGWAETKEITG